MFDFTLKDDSENTLEKCGIYKITCTANGKFYVGCTYSTFKKRLTLHKSSLNLKKHYAHYMQNCYNKYGFEAFEIEIVEVLPKTDPDLIYKREDYWIDLLQPHFNYPPTANSMIFVKADDSTERKLHAKNRSGHRNICLMKDGRFSVQICDYRVGRFTTLEEAIIAKEQFLLNPVYREPKPPSRSGEKYITYHKDGWVVDVQEKYVGFYKELTDAIKARDEFLALPIDQQVGKVFKGSNTGHKNIQYRARTNRYRVVFGDDEVASSCKTLEEAIEVKEKFLATGERPTKQKTGCGHKFIMVKSNGRYAVTVDKNNISTYKTLKEALSARDAYLRCQNRSGDCGSISATTSATGSSINNPKSSSDTQSS